jgi:hypothetical protein
MPKESRRDEMLSCLHLELEIWNSAIDGELESFYHRVS